MSEYPDYLNTPQHRQIEKQIYSQSFTESSQINDSNSTSMLNASKLAVEVFEENQRLIAHIEKMKQNHRKEIRNLVDEYDAKLSKSYENEKKYTRLLQEKDEIIRDLKQQNDQIQRLNLQYEKTIGTHCIQIEKLQEALDKVDTLTKENQILKNQKSEINNNFDDTPNKYYQSTSNSYKSPSSQTQTRMISNLNSSSLMPNNGSFNFDSTNNNFSDSKDPASVDIRYGRRRPYPNHPALKDQISYYLSQNIPNPESREYPLNDFTFSLNELKTTLRALNTEKNEIIKRLNKAPPCENTTYFSGLWMQKENDEKHLDELDKMIGRIRLELKRLGEF